MDKLLIENVQPYLEPSGYELYRGVQLRESENSNFTVYYWYQFDRNGHETFQDFDKALSRYTHYEKDIFKEG